MSLQTAGLGNAIEHQVGDEPILCEAVARSFVQGERPRSNGSVIAVDGNVSTMLASLWSLRYQCCCGRDAEHRRVGIALEPSPALITSGRHSLRGRVGNGLFGCDGAE